MTVNRYRGVDEMPPLSRATGEDLAARIRGAWARAFRLAGGVFQAPGVEKFPDIESAQRARQEAIQQRIRRLRQQRRAEAKGQ